MNIYHCFPRRACFFFSNSLIKNRNVIKLFVYFLKSKIKIQRHFAKFLIFNKTGQYPPRGRQQETLLECVQLHSLASRHFAKIKFFSDVFSYSVEL
jgi:hypothetical protein